MHFAQSGEYMKNTTKGFTLIELLIAVAIVGILTAIALPSYNSSIVKGSRASVQTELMQAAAIEEKIYLNSNSYSVSTNIITDAYTGQSTGGLGWNATSKDGKYSFSCPGCSASVYTLTATPVPGRPQADDGTLSINQMGNKVWTLKNGSATTW